MGGRQVPRCRKGAQGRKRPDQSPRREARQAETLEAQHQQQQRRRELERKRKKQRQEIFKVEDEIESKRDELIPGLEKRLSQSNTAEALFTIRWSVVWAELRKPHESMS
jgi:hypothetical protein